MSPANPPLFRLAAAVGAGLCVAIAAAQDCRESLEMLGRSMRQQYGTNVVAIVTQRAPDGRGFHTLKIERSRDGRVRRTMLQPLRMQGMEWIDDGQRMLVYMPDERRVLEQPSLRDPDEVIESRVRLLAANYAVRQTGTLSIAGRTAVRIVTSPRAAGLDTRVYLLDKRTSLPLRIEVVHPGGETDTLLDTKMVRFGDELDDDHFRMSPLGKVSWVKYPPVELLALLDRPADSLGFDPRLPTNLPLGFRVVSTEVSPSRGWRSLVVRMTDGVVRATLYAWRGEQAKMTDRPGRTVRSVDDVQLVLVADMEAKPREQLLQAFIEARGAGASILPEPQPSPETSER